MDDEGPVYVCCIIITDTNKETHVAIKVPLANPTDEFIYDSWEYVPEDQWWGNLKSTDTTEDIKKQAWGMLEEFYFNHRKELKTSGFVNLSVDCSSDDSSDDISN